MMETMRQPPPLAGIRVLDLTQFMSGPFATQILGDLGAEIIKVEQPDGDLSRHMPPHFVGDDSAYFLCLNRNKKSIALDLKLEADQQLLVALADQCDVVIENFRPGVAERLGLDPVALRKRRPELVWCSISGFGGDGPYRDLPAYDMIVQAMSGGMSLTGERDGRPVRAGVPIADLCAGLYAVIGIVAALHRREVSERGDALDISMLDCQVAMLTYQAAYVLAGGERPGPQGRGHESIPTYDSFVASDGVDVVVAASTERMWRDLARVLDRSSLVNDPRFADMGARNKHREELTPLLREAFTQRPAREWVAALKEVSVPVSAVLPVDEVVLDAHVRKRGMIVEMVGATGSAAVTGSPLKFAETAFETPRFPPRLNEHHDEIKNLANKSAENRSAN